MVSYLNTPMFQDFLGMLDPEGNGSAVFDATGHLNLPLGLIMNFAYALNKPWNFASNAVDIEVVP